MHKPPLSFAKLRTVPPPFSWVDQRLVRERDIDQLTQEACALDLCLGTVADAQGLSSDAERSLCRRLSMAPSELHRARQPLIQRGLLAYAHPLSQVLALDAPPQVAVPDSPRMTAADKPIALKAMFKHRTESLS